MRNVIFVCLQVGRFYVGALEKDTLCTREQPDDNGKTSVIVKAHEKVKFLTLEEPATIKTTVGRVFLNEVLPTRLVLPMILLAKK
jgi:DNA-directed RNA polymerase subunit beta'